MNDASRFQRFWRRGFLWVGILLLALAGLSAWRIAASQDGVDGVEQAHEPAGEAGALQLRQVRVTTEAGAPVVELVIGGRVRAITQTLHHPERFLIKLRNAALTWKPAVMEVSRSPLKRIRAAQHGKEIWVVFDLSEPISWSLQVQDSGIRLRPASSAAGQASPDVSREKTPASKPAEESKFATPLEPEYQVVDLDAEALADRTRMTVTTNGQARYRIIREHGGEGLTLTLYGASLAWRHSMGGVGLIRRINASQRIEEGETVVRIALALSQAAPFTVFKEQNQVVVELTPAGMISEPAAHGNLQARLSADFQNAELASTLRALTQDAGFDLVLTPGAQAIPESQAQVTLTMNEQPLETILDFVLRPRKLAYTVTANTVRVGLASEFPAETRVFSLKNADAKNTNLETALAGALTEGSNSKVTMDAAANRVIVTAIPSDMARVQAVLQHMDAQRNEITRKFALNYASTKKVAPMVRPLLSTAGRLEENEQENALVVTDISGNINRAAQLIRSLDTKAQQVMIEARIVEIGVSNEQDFGIQWGANKTGPGVDPQISLSQTPLAGGKVAELTVGSVQSGVDLNATLTALEAKGAVNVISNPRVATVNNQTATLRASQNIPYMTSHVSNGVVSNAIQYLELPILLSVTPQIAGGQQVFLNPLSVTVTTIVGAQSPPATTSRTTTTQMMVADGETIAIGGLVRDEEGTRDSQIPLLGDIPVLGYLFKSTVKVKNKVELVVFLTSHILD